MAWLNVIGAACMVASFTCFSVVSEHPLVRATVALGAAASGAATVAALATILAKAA